MYSKIMTSLFFTISMISFLTGCSSPFETKMQPAMSQSLSLGSENTQCLSKAPLQVEKYFNGQSNSEEISSMWNCTSKALDLFGKYVRGKNPGMYTPDELRSFLEKYFLGDLKISNDLLDSLMKLKNVVIGGGSNQITVDEIKKTQSIFEDLKRESVKIIGLHPIRPTHYNDKSFDQLDYVATELVASSNRISAILSNSVNDYQMDDLRKLLLNLSVFLKQSNVNIVEIETILKYFEPIKMFKRILISGSSETIQKSDWEKILVGSSKWYSWILKYNQLTAQKTSWISGEALDRFHLIITEAKNNFSDSLKLWKEDTIPFEDLDKTIDAIGNNLLQELISPELTTKTLKKSIRPLIQKIMAGYDKSQFGRRAIGLTLVALERTWSEIDRFFKTQKLLDKIFSQVDPHFLIGERFNRKEILEAFDKINPDNLLEKEIFIDLNKVISTFHPFYFDQSNRIGFPANESDANLFSFYNFYRMNINRTISRIVIAAYAEDKLRAEKHIGLLEIEFTGSYDFQTPWKVKTPGIYTDFYDLGVELKVCQYFPETWKRKAGNSRFTEANLFTYVADGGNYLNLDELTQLFAILWSTKDLSNQVHEDFVPLCPAKGLDSYNAPNIDSKCFLNSFFSNKKNYYRKYWEKMPKLILHFESLLPQEKSSFIQLIDHAVRGSRQDNLNIYNTDDLDTFAALLHYVEAMFARYDANYDGVINRVEADEAFKVFINKLSSVSGFTKQYSNKVLFHYLLYYGEAPNAESLVDKAKYAVWFMQEPFVEIAADRTKILQILTALSSM